MEKPVMRSADKKRCGNAVPTTPHASGDSELKKWGALRGQGKSREASINVYLSW